MKTFKPLFVPNVDYTGVSHHKDTKWCRLYKRKRSRLSFHNYSDEARLVDEVEAKIRKQCQWLIDYLFENAEDIARLRPLGTPTDKVNATKLLLSIRRVAIAKVQQDWAEYGTAILQMNTFYIYALELRYNRECGYVDPMVVIGSNRHGWRKQTFNPEGRFISPNNRPFGRYQKADK